MTFENEFLDGAVAKAGLLRCKAMIDREHDLLITRLAEILNISRSAV